MHPIPPPVPMAPANDDLTLDDALADELERPAYDPLAPDLDARRDEGRGEERDESDSELSPAPPAPTEVDLNIAERLANYGKSQFRNHGGQGSARERDWDLSPPSTPEADDDERETFLPYAPTSAGPPGSAGK
jgi:hypothetical protein